MGETSLRATEELSGSIFASEAHFAYPLPLFRLTQIDATFVDVTQLFSLRENAIAKEPGSSYFKPRRCVSRLGLATGGSDSLESSPYVTLSRGAFRPHPW